MNPKCTCFNEAKSLQDPHVSSACPTKNRVTPRSCRFYRLSSTYTVRKMYLSCHNEVSYANQFSQSSLNKNFSNCRSNHNPTDGCQHKFLSSGPTVSDIASKCLSSRMWQTCPHNGAYQFWHLNNLGASSIVPLNSSTSLASSNNLDRTCNIFHQSRVDKTSKQVLLEPESSVTTSLHKTEHGLRISPIWNSHSGANVQQHCKVVLSLHAFSQFEM